MTLNFFKSIFKDESSISSEKPLFFIVALDGGGVRGALQCEILARLFQKFPWLEKRVDMYAGSSIGAFLASALATRDFESAQECCTQHQFAQIFRGSWKRDAESVDGWYEAKYDNKPVLEFCSQFFGNQTFATASKKLLVTAFKVDSTSDDKDIDPLCAKYFSKEQWQPAIFHNLDPNNDNLQHKSIGEALLQSSAAPGYFPVHNKCIDGGMLSNNPSMIAICYAMQHRLVESLDQIVLLSLGTGRACQNLSSYGENADLGVAQWLPHITDLLMQSNSECSVIECASLLGSDRFFRLQPVLQSPIGLDDYEKIPLLKKIAQDQNLDEVEQFLEQIGL